MPYGGHRRRLRAVEDARDQRIEAREQERPRREPTDVRGALRPRARHDPLRVAVHCHLRVLGLPNELSSR